MKLIRITDEVVISPLRTDEVINPDRLVILQYNSDNSATDTVRVLNEIPIDVLQTDSFHIDGNLVLHTNHDLLP